MRVINWICYLLQHHLQVIKLYWNVLFSFLQPMLYHSNQIIYDDRGLFSAVYKDSNLYNYGDPNHNEEKT